MNLHHDFWQRFNSTQGLIFIVKVSSNQHARFAMIKLDFWCLFDGKTKNYIYNSVGVFVYGNKHSEEEKKCNLFGIKKTP